LPCVRLQVNAKAAEHKRIDALNDLLPPGTKIQIKGATVRMGVIMLEPKCVKVRSRVPAQIYATKLL